MIELTQVEIAFIGIVLIQIIYWAIWLIGVLKIKPGNSTPQEQGVSVVVAANNELENLKKLLPKLIKQDYNLFEIIIVDDRSSDGSFEFLLESTAKYNNLKVLTVSDLPNHLDAKKYAITLGIKSATYDQILLTDADCEPASSKWIASFAQAWSNKSSFILGFSPYQKQPGLLNYFIRFETLLTGIQYLSAAALGKPYMGVGRNLCYSKSLFLANKGFHGIQNIRGGDDDIFVNKYANGSNTKVLLNEESNTYSIPKKNVKKYFIQKTRHLSVGKYYSSKSKIILTIFTLTWILTWGLLPFELLFTKNLILPLGFLLGRYILMATTFGIFLKKSRVKFNLLGMMLLDFMFVLYYFVAATKTLFTKQVKWS